MRKKVGGCRRYGRGWGRAALRFVLLMVPALFWSATFASLAGARPLELLPELAPDAARLLSAAACLVLAALLGVEFPEHGGRRAGEVRE